jgi:hypothetical protein
MSFLSEATRATVAIRTFGFMKIPLLWACRPKVVKIDDKKCVIKIPHRRRTRNHEKGLYIAAMTVGAELASGALAIRTLGYGKGKKFIYKSFHADYLKRAEDDVYFTCNEGTALNELAQQAKETGERQNMSIHVTATVPSKLGDEPVAKFILTLSVKDETGAVNRE